MRFLLLSVYCGQLLQHDMPSCPVHTSLLLPVFLILNEINGDGDLSCLWADVCVCGCVITITRNCVRKLRIFLAPPYTASAAVFASLSDFFIMLLRVECASMQCAIWL